MNFDRNNPQGYAHSRAHVSADIDHGLRTYMLNVYNYMFIGLLFTGFVAMFMHSLAVSSVPTAYSLGNGRFLTELGYTIYISPLRWIIMFAPLALVFFLGFRVHKMPVSTSRMIFFAYSALVGLSLSWIFMVYTPKSITQVFFLTSASFAGLSLYGYTTKKNLSGLGSFLLMGLIGLILASIVNLFLANDTLQFVISVFGVLIFAGLTAYDTQKIKEMYDQLDNSEVAGRKAIMGALMLYLDFINMFMFLLHLLGNRE